MGYSVGLVENNDECSDDVNNNNNNNYLAPTFQTRLCVLHILPSILLTIVQENIIYLHFNQITSPVNSDTYIKH